MGKPEIRFKGYTDEWEQRKLGDVAQEFKSGNSLKADEIDITGDYPVYGGNGLRGYTSTYNHDGEYALIGRQGALCGNMNYSAGKAYFTEHAVVVKADENNVTRFLYYMLDTMNLGQYSDQSAQPGLAVNKLVKLENSFPKKEEQQQIGAYFRSLDHLITLHQRKCDEVKSLKKYMLQKMFPQNEQKVPEIRFEGFTEAWEQRKLGDVTESIKNGYTYKADGSREHQYKITRIESISSGAINIEKLGSSDNVNENYKLEDGDILFSHINSLPYIANTAIYTSNLGEIYHGMNLLNIRAKHEIIDSHFLLHLLKKESSRNWFRIIAKPAVNQASISTTEVSSFVFMMPNMEEQKRISSVLDNIDNLLTLHQQKCEELKKIKKFMLQKMFV